MPPSTFFRETWGPAKPYPPEQLRPDAEIAQVLTAPRPEGSKLPPSPLEIELRTINGVTLRHWKYVPSVYRDLWLNAVKTFGDREYITYEEETLTFNQAYQQSLLIARWLQVQFQVRRGDRVAIACRNNLEHVTAWWACHLIGAVATLINAFADSATLTFCIQDSGCRVLVCDVERWEKLKPTAQTLFKTSRPNDEDDVLRAIAIIPFGKGKGIGRLPKAKRTYLPSDPSDPFYGLVHDFEALSDKYTADTSNKAPSIVISPEDYATILYTSGTTGKPKGVVSTQRQSLHNLGAALYGGPRAYLRRHRPLPDPTKNPDIPSALVAYPLFHAAGMLTGLVAGTFGGQRTVFMYAWDVDEAVKLVNKYKLARVAGVAFQARQLAMHPAEMPTLGGISHGGSPSARELSQESFKKTGEGLAGMGYGATETNAIATGCMQDDYANWPDSVGMPPPTTEIKIMDPGKLVEVPVGKSGEIWIRGPGVATGYWKRPEASAEVFLPDGFYRTGDVGRLNSHGALFILDRVKDMIIRGGENISCIVVENAVYSHPDVVECAAVGLPDSSLGERVAVFVVPRPGVSVEQVRVEDVRTVAANLLSKFQIPEFIHVQAEPLPKIPAGKIDKKELREHLEVIAREKKWGDFANPKSKL